MVFFVVLGGWKSSTTMQNTSNQSGTQNINLQGISDSNINIQNYNFGKYDTYQEMQTQLEEYREILEDLPESKADKRGKYQQKISQQLEKIEAFKHEVLRLAETFSKIEINSERLKQAKAYFEEGKLREADAILKTEDLQQEQRTLLAEKARHEEKGKELAEDLRHNASEFLLKAQLRATQFDEKRMEETCAFFEQALNSYRSAENLFVYAYFLQEHKQFNNAINLFKDALNIYRKKRSEKTVVYERDIALTLNNLGVLYKTQGRFEDAREAYQEALEIREKLTQQSQEIEYKADLANTLDSLSTLLSAEGKFIEAESTYMTALAILRELSAKAPEAYERHFAETLNNLACLYYNQNRFRDAQSIYEDVLSIYGKISIKKSNSYIYNITIILNNLATSLLKQGCFTRAEKVYKDALKLRNSLVEDNPDAYKADLATTLNNLAALYHEKEVLGEAKNMYEQALTIREALYEKNKDAFALDYAQVLVNLSSLNIRDREEATSLAKKSILILKPFLQDSHQAQQYIQPAVQVLQAWGIDVQAWLESRSGEA